MGLLDSLLTSDIVTGRGGAETVVGPNGRAQYTTPDGTAVDEQGGQTDLWLPGGKHHSLWDSGKEIETGPNGEEVGDTGVTHAPGLLVSEEQAEAASRRQEWLSMLPGASVGGDLFDALFDPGTGDLEFPTGESGGGLADMFPSELELEGGWAMQEIEQERVGEQQQALRDLTRGEGGVTHVPSLLGPEAPASDPQSLLLSLFPF